MYFSPKEDSLGCDRACGPW